MPFEDYLGSRTPPADGSEGTASIKLTLKGKEEPLKLNGCFIPNDENLKKLINDRTYLEKHKKTKFFIYFCCLDKNLENNVVKTEINAHRFTKPNRDKQCTIDHGPDSAFLLYKEFHVFLPACHKDLKTNDFESFLKKHSKRIPSQFHQVTANGQYKGLTQKEGLVKFVPVRLTSSNGSQVLEDSSFIKVVNGPFLDSNEVVGYCCKESDGSRINVNMLGTQDVTVVSSGIAGPFRCISSQDVELYSIKLKEAITKITELLPRGITKSTLKTDDIFTNLTVYQGKQKSLQERAQEDQRTRKIVTDITEIFVDENEDNPKSILVSGEPGIGKTLFSNKILRDLSTYCLSIPNIKFPYLITFRQIVMLGNKELTLRELLNISPLLNTSTMIDDTVMAHAIHHSEQFFVVLDGFDEYEDDKKILGSFESQFPNDAKIKMPIVALISKLIQKKIF
ncbi:uncharacterized protein LOC114576416 [Exaiptasia diaphana]|uniref:NACHT domain-containing protein n=1 Tax=Exaiptasia diaphana TaxID=2652724 RepID=A0A913YXP8_EXADI|nr:uncharacterized protein LOC114576416 [Exaiptasia diaphana]XP_028518861.1 uncharacterized protein LOC114576416 [Exaiptasia diaphana]